MSLIIRSGKAWPPHRLRYLPPRPRGASLSSGGETTTRHLPGLSLCTIWVFWKRSHIEKDPEDHTRSPFDALVWEMVVREQSHKVSPASD